MERFNNGILKHTQIASSAQSNYYFKTKLELFVFEFVFLKKHQ